MKYGPNVTRLLAQFIGREAIPPGGSFNDGIAFLTDPQRRKAGIELAEKNMLAALKLIKTAPDNPFGNDDEAIAADLLKKIEQRKAMIRDRLIKQAQTERKTGA